MNRSAPQGQAPQGAPQEASQRRGQSQDQGQSSVPPARLPPTPASLAHQITEQAESLGFDAVGFTSARLAQSFRTQLKDFLAKGYHGSMGWLAANAERRSSPDKLWPQARTAIVLAMNYGPGEDPLRALAWRRMGNLSVYARNHDYHRLLMTRGKALGRWLTTHLPCDVKIFCDTAPVMEKPLAMLAGIGWQGKHSNLVSRSFGSWLFLCTLLTDIEIPTTPAEKDHCGSCRRCLDICPTSAFVAPYQLDARLCISYLTIEHRGHITRALRAKIGNRIYGCDDCLAVCPWNKFARRAREQSFHAQRDRLAPNLAQLSGLGAQGFRTVFHGAPIKRIGWSRFLRNVLIAIGNSAQPNMAMIPLRHLHDSESIVRVAAIWAAARLMTAKDFILLAERNANGDGDGDEEVIKEWHASLHDCSLLSGADKKSERL